MANVIPKGWLGIQLDNVVEIFDSKRIPLNSNDREFKKGSFPYYGTNGQIDSIDDYIFDGEFVLLAEDGGYFDDTNRPVAYFVNGKFWANNHVHVLKVLGKIPTNYIIHSLNHANILPLVSGTTRLKLNQSAMRKIPILLPPLNEQKRIIYRIEELQSSSRRAREALDSIPDLLDQLRQSILSAAFRGDLTKEWRKNHPDVEPATELLKRIRAERRKRWEDAEMEKLKAKGLTADKLQEAFANRCKQYQEPAATDTRGLPDLPEGWTWCKLSDLGYMNRGKSKHRPRNAPHLYGGKYPFIQTGDIAQSNGRITTHHQTYSENGLKQSKLWPEGTICITIAANIANSGILTYPACFPDSVVGILVDDRVCKSEYAEYFIRTIKGELAQFAPATAQKNINIEVLNKIYIPLAPRLEADMIVELLDASHSNIEKTEFSIKKNFEQLALIDQSILSKAFRGELVPQDPNDEPAAILLERIRQEKADAISNTKDKRKNLHSPEKSSSSIRSGANR